MSETTKKDHMIKPGETGGQSPNITRVQFDFPIEDLIGTNGQETEEIAAPKRQAGRTVKLNVSIKSDAVDFLDSEANEESIRTGHKVNACDIVRRLVDDYISNSTKTKPIP